MGLAGVASEGFGGAQGGEGLPAEGGLGWESPEVPLSCP